MGRMSLLALLTLLVVAVAEVCAVREVKSGRKYGRSNKKTLGSQCSKVWTKMPSMPKNLGEVSAGVVKIKNQSHLCVVGEGSSDTQCYNFKRRKWVKASKRPCVGHHHCVVNRSGKMYLFGGLGGCDKDAQVFDGRKWKKLARLPFKSGSGSCSYRNGKFHLCGGIDGKVTKKRCASYDAKRNKWTVRGSSKIGVNHAAYCQAGDRLYMIAGRGGGNVVGPAKSLCQTYNIKTKRTGTCRGLPYPTGGVGNCVNSSGGLWVFGGELNDKQFAGYGRRVGGKKGGAGGTLSAVSFASKGKWLARKRMPVAKHGIFPVVWGGHVYVAGGGVKAANSSSKTMHRARLSTLKRCKA